MLYIFTHPSSGHHYLMRLLEQACDLPEGWHCDVHMAQPTGDTLVIKDHDFKLNSPPPPNIPILLQYRRDWLAATESWYDLGIRTGYWKDDSRGWRRFAANKAYWTKSFLRRHEQHADLTIAYEDLVKDPVHWTKKAAELAELEWREDPKKENRELRRTKEYRYYDRLFFFALQAVYDAL